jgi:hypothetical protein
MIIALLAVLGEDLIVIAVILAGVPGPAQVGARGRTRSRVRYVSPAAVSTGSRPAGIGATAAEFATSCRRQHFDHRSGLRGST